MPVFNKMVYNGTEYILGGGGNIGEPLNLTVTSAGLDATITWEDNEIGTIPPTTFQKSELVRKIGSAPTSPSDGTLVVTETVKDSYKVSGYTDSGLTDGETYYYRVFSYSDLGGISYCDAVSVTISNSWQPGANTIAYYPLTSTSTVNDESGNNHTLTTYDSLPTFGTYQGVDCANFSSNSLYTSQVNPSVYGTDYTVSLYVCSNKTGDSIPIMNIYVTNAGISPVWNNWMIRTDSNTYKVQTVNGTNATFNLISTSNTWTHLLFTVSNNVITTYKNGVQIATGALGNVANGGNLTIGCGMDEQEASQGHGTYGKYQGGISEVIIEDKVWTAQEVADYYDQTKGDYGIS